MCYIFLVDSDCFCTYLFWSQLICFQKDINNKLSKWPSLKASQILNSFWLKNNIPSHTWTKSALNKILRFFGQSFGANPSSSKSADVIIAKDVHFCTLKSLCLPHLASCSVWPALVKFRHFGKKIQVFCNSMKISLEFSNPEGLDPLK